MRKDLHEYSYHELIKVDEYLSNLFIRQSKEAIDLSGIEESTRWKIQGMLDILFDYSMTCDSVYKREQELKNKNVN